MAKRYTYSQRSYFFILLFISLPASIIAQNIGSCVDTVYLVSPTNNYSSANYWGIQANKVIKANNIINGAAKVNLKARSILIEPGALFDSQNGSTVSTTLADYQPVGQYPLLTILEEKEAIYGNYCVDAYGGIYKVNEKIIIMDSVISSENINSEALIAKNLIQSKNPGLVITEEFCPCNPYLRIWRGLGLDKLDNNTIKIQGEIAVNSTSNRIRDAELNYYISNDENGLPNLPNIPALTLAALRNVNYGDPSLLNTFKVAVLDNGVDYTNAYFAVNSNVKFTFWKNANDPINGVDDDGNGFVDDYAIGYNFVSKNNNPFNDGANSNRLSHGTKVLSLIYNKFVGINIPFEVIFEKVTDENGVGEEFNMLCAMYHAAQNGAKVINMSIGGYKPENENAILSDVLMDLKKQDIIVVAAAGNGWQNTTNGNIEPVDLDTSSLKFYPASLSRFDNVYAISSANTTATSVCLPLNYGSTYVDIGVKTGGDCVSTCPIDNSSLRGTSFTTPIATAAIIKEYYNGIIPYKSNVLNPSGYMMPNTGQNLILRAQIINGVFMNN
jgi:hypothetical protein